MINISLSINAKGERSLEISGFSTDFVDENFPDFVDTLVERLHITEGLPTNSMQHSSDNHFAQSNSPSQVNSNTTASFSSKPNNGSRNYMNQGDRCFRCTHGLMQMERTINHRTKEAYDHLVCGKGCGFTAYLSKYNNGSNKPVSQTSSTIS